MDITAFDLAQRFVGTKEVPGAASNPQVLAMLQLDGRWPKDDAVPWCSAFVNYIAWLLRLPRSKSLAARSWLTVGRAIELRDAVPGYDVVVLARGDNKANGHVGFFAGYDGVNVHVLAGNQGDAVSVATFGPAHVLGVRRLVAALLLVVAGAWGAPAAAQTAISPAAVKVANSPNVLAWPVTTRIARLELADQGVRVTFDRCAAWPDVTPPGWAGPLRFTLWLFEQIGGEWYGAGIIQFWGCDQYNGGPIYQDRQIARNWVYDNRWSAMVGHQPQPGERIGIMVSAGNARGEDDHLVAERSDIVELLMPTSAATYPPAPFAAVEGVFVPAPPIVTPPPPIFVPPPAPLPSTDLTPAVLQQLQLLDARVANLAVQVQAGRDENAAFFESVRSTWKATLGKIAPYLGTAIAAILAGRATK